MVTIIIPVHNGEKFIQRAIDSVKVQRGDWELIVVNDHSTDNTVEILTEYTVNQVLPITVLSSKNLGVTEARICGAKHAAGDYLFFMDADDELPPYTIETITKEIIEDTSLDMVIGDIVEVKQGVKSTWRYGEENLTSGSDLFNWIVDHRMGYLWGKAIRKDLFMSIPYVPSQLKFCEDYVQMLQLSLKAKNIKHIGIASYRYIQNPQSVCNGSKTREEYGAQFYSLAVALKSLIESNYFQDSKNENGIAPMERLKVMFLYYARLYLGVSGSWGLDPSQLKPVYKEWMQDDELYKDPLYNVHRMLQTKVMYYFHPIIAMCYSFLLKYKYHRIK